MRFNFVLIFLFSLTFNRILYAERVKVYRLSPTFSFSINKTDIQVLDLITLNSKWFQFNSKTTDLPITLVVLKETPDTIANKYSVERYWKSLRERTKLLQKREENFGCKALDKRSYSCSRNVVQNGKFSSETIYWNLKKDLILFRTSSNSSFKESRQFLDNIKITIDSRMPAGARK